VDDYQIKGSSIQSKLDYVREVLGKEQEEEVRDMLRQRGIVLLLQSSWYPAEVYEDLNLFLAEEFFGGNIERLLEVGEFSARRALKSTYKAYLEGGDFARFLQRISSFHERFFSEGTMEVRPGVGSCEILLSGARRYPQPDVQIARGFYSGAARCFGLENVSCSAAPNADGMRFLLTWTDPAS